MLFRSIEIACPAIKRDDEKADFAAGEFRAAGRRIAPQALRALVSAFSDDVTELAAACQQLITDVQGDVTPELVERYYGGRVEVSAFVVAATAIAGRLGEALVALRHALAPKAKSALGPPKMAPKRGVTDRKPPPGEAERVQAKLPDNPDRQTRCRPPKSRWPGLRDRKSTRLNSSHRT